MDARRRRNRPEWLYGMAWSTFANSVVSISLTGSAASITGTNITITATSSGSLTAAVFGVEYGIGRAAGYMFSMNVVGAASSQSITIGAGEGIVANDIVNVRAYCNDDVLDAPGTRIYGSAIVPDLGVRGIPSGTVTSGQTLTVAASTEAAAAGASAMTITYKWQCSTDSNFTSPTGTNIGTSISTYLLTDSEIGSYIRVGVIETNSAGASTIVYSSPTATTVIAAGSFFLLNSGSGLDTIQLNSGAADKLQMN